MTPAPTWGLVLILNPINMAKRTIKVGDKFKTKNDGNAHAGYTIILNKVIDDKNDDGWGFWKSYHERDGGGGRRVNFKARIWWFREWCDKVD